MGAGKNPLLGSDAGASDMLRDLARQSLPDLLSEGVYITDPLGTILEVNEPILAITGYARDEVVGRHPSIFHSGVHDQTFYAMLWLELAKRGTWSGVVWNRRKSGEVYKQQLRIQALRSPETGEVAGYQAAALDLTALCADRPRDAAGTPIAHDRSSFMADLRALLLSNPDAHAAICIVDIDRFTEINALHGEAIADRLLAEIAVRLRRCLREYDAVTRLSGDEFAFFLSRMDDISQVSLAVRRVHDALQKPYEIDGQVIDLTMCIGSAVYPYDRGSASALMRAAAHALVAAKAGGRGQVRQYLAPAAAEDLPGARIGAQVEEGLRQGQMRLHYQPKVDMATGEVVGMEALLRWQHPERGLIAPDEFLKRVRSQRILMDIGEWALSAALGQVDAWRRRHGSLVRISVNLIAEQVSTAGFARRLARIADRYAAVPLSCLEIEVVDGGALNDFADARTEMCACRDMGVSFSIDDLGALTADIDVLDGLPVGILKIDRFFVEGLCANPTDREIVEKAIALGARLGRKVIAEGVETEEIGMALLEMGIRHAQGFAVARPMPPEDIFAWIEAYTSPASWRAAVSGAPARAEV